MNLQAEKACHRAKTPSIIQNGIMFQNTSIKKESTVKLLTETRQLANE